MNELNDDLLDLIFLSVTIVKDIRSFISVNKRMNIRYKDEIEKYKLKIYVNQDYLSFYEYLYRYSYGESFMDQIIAKAFMNIPKIWPSPVVEMYDLRYIFELMCKGYALESEEIKNYNIHFYIHFYHKIKECLDSDRKKTIQNIEKDSYLFSLKQDPKIKSSSKNGSNFQWISIHKD